MMAYLGFGFLVLAFIIALYAICAAVYGARSKTLAFIESARRAAIIVFPLVSLAVIMLVILMLRGQFQYTYVFRVTSLDMPKYLILTALWGGQAGSLLFWVWILTFLSAVVSIRELKRNLDQAPWVIVVLMVTLAFFLFMVLFFENPFERIWLFADGSVASSFLQPLNSIAVVPSDGSGLNPLLRHLAMVIHPPLLYIGFVSFVIPFGYAIASLMNDEKKDDWLVNARRWSLISWLFLSAGLVTGSRWAYDVLGWGGYWGWDPVEIAAFMPWLTCTAFLHSALMEERRGNFKRWNYILVMITFSLVILGTFLTRSGVLSSVHAFSASTIGPVFFVLISITVLVSLALILRHWGELSSPGRMKSFFSRDALFFFNNLLLMCIFLICLTGVLFPLVSEVLTGRQVTVGAQWYKATTGPLFALLLLVMGIVPLSAWGASSARSLRRLLWKPAVLSLAAPILLVIFGVRSTVGIFALWLAALVILVVMYDFLHTIHIHRNNIDGPLYTVVWKLFRKNSRHYGATLIHLGVVLMAVGVVGMEFFQSQTQSSINQGGIITLGDYSLRLNDIQSFRVSSTLAQTVADLSVSKNGKGVAELHPRIDSYLKAGQAVTIPGLISSFGGDLYVVLVDWQPGTNSGVTFRVFQNPLINWLWIGSIILIMGGLAAFWPRRSTLAQVQTE